MPRRKATREQLEHDIAMGLRLIDIQRKYGYKNIKSLSTSLSALGLRTRVKENERKQQQGYTTAPKAHESLAERFQRPIVYQYWGNGKLEGYNRLEEFWAQESYTNIPAPEGEVNRDAA